MKFNKLIGVLCLAIIAAFACGDAFAQKKPSLTGTQIVQKMAAQYAGAKSYKDEGYVQVIKPDGSARRIESVNSFKTFYVRPNRFRFEWEANTWDGRKPGNILWSDGKDTFSYHAWGAVEKVEDIGTAIGYAAGVSTGAAEMVTSLLMENVGGFRITELTRISLLRQEEFEGENCFVVRGHHPSGAPIDLWISKNDFSLRKERENDEDGNIYEDVRRNVRFNEPIPEQIFRSPTPEKKDLWKEATLVAER